MNEALGLISPIIHLGGDTLGQAGYNYIQTRPPSIEMPSLGLDLDGYVLEIARRYTTCPSPHVLNMSPCLTPSTRVGVILACHSAMIYNRGKRLWVDEVLTEPHKKKEVLGLGNALPWQVIVGYVMVDLIQGKTITHIEKTDIQVARLTPAEVEGYAHLDESSYSIGPLYLKGKGALYVSCIQGSFFNAMGCCPCVVRELSRSLGTPSSHWG